VESHIYRLSQRCFIAARISNLSVSITL